MVTIGRRPLFLGTQRTVGGLSQLPQFYGFKGVGFRFLGGWDLGLWDLGALGLLAS